MKKKYIVKDAFADAYLLWDNKSNRYTLQYTPEYYKVDRYKSYEDAETAIQNASANLNYTFTILEIYEKE